MAARKAPRPTQKPKKPPSKKAKGPEKPPSKKAKGVAEKTPKRPSPKTSKNKKASGPKEASIRRQLKTIRSVFASLGLEFTERYDGASRKSHFSIDTGVGELEDIQVIHVPGVLTLYARFGVRPEERHRRELERFASRMNSALHHGCVVLHGTPPGVSFRASVDYSSVKDLERGYVGRLLGDAISMIETIDLPLVLIAQGKRADEAIAQVLELPEVALLPRPD